MELLNTTNDTYRYHVDHDWAQLPDGLAWGITHGSAVDSHGHIYIAHTRLDNQPGDCIQVFAPNGEWLRSWGPEFHGQAHGLEIVMLNHEEVVLVTDLKRGLFCCSLLGEIHWKINKPSFYKERPHLSWMPSNAIVDDQNRVHLSDGYGTYFITVIDANGKELGQYGGPGLSDEHTHGPHGLGLVNGEILVCENKPGEMHRYTLDGKHIGKWQHPDFKMPRHITHINGNLLILTLQVTSVCGHQQVIILRHLVKAPLTPSECLTTGQNPSPNCQQDALWHRTTLPLTRTDVSMSLNGWTMVG